MNEAIWGGNVRANFNAARVIWEVEFANSTSKSLSAGFDLQSGNLAVHVASKLAAGWSAQNGLFSAVSVGRSVYFSGTVISMRFKLDGAKDWTLVPTDYSAVQVVPGLFVFLG
jgi:hypothetical protein